MFFYNFWFPESLERLPMFRKVFHQLEKTIYIFLCCYDCHHLKLKDFLSPSLQGRGARAAECNSAALLSANSGARGQEVRRRGASSLLSAALTGGGRTQQLASSHTKDNLLWKQNRQWRHDAKVKLPSVWKAVQDELELIKVD